MNTGWAVQLCFSIDLHEDDKPVLVQIKQSLGVGEIRKIRGNMVDYTVRSIKDLLVIIKHFDAYPLLSQKQADYQLFKEVYLLIKNKEHLTVSGLKKIVALKAKSD